MQFYAHSNEFDKSEWQGLKEHLLNTAQLASSLGADSGLSEFAAITALLHDIGKYSLPFQEKLDRPRIRL